MAPLTLGESEWFFCRHWGDIPGTDGTTKVHGGVVNASNNRNISLSDEGLDGDLSGSLIERTADTDEGLGGDEGCFVGTSSILVDKVDLETLTEDNERNSDKDENLSALAVLHEDTDEDGGNLESNTEGITVNGQYGSLEKRYWTAYSIRVEWPGLNPPATWR